MTPPAPGRVDVLARHGAAEVWTGPLPHGHAPGDVLRSRGWLPLGPPRATSAGDGRIVLAYDVAPAVPGGSDTAGDAGAADRGTSVTAGAVSDPRHGDEAGAAGEPAERVQRVAAYVVVWSTQGLLATQFSELTRVAGAWGLPGGGVEPDEDPVQAAQRECWEETGQVVTVGALLDVTSRHWVGRAPSGRLEDFHAVALHYAGSCDRPTVPQVHDVGGTTSAAAWVPRSEVESWRWAAHYAWVTTTAPR